MNPVIEVYKGYKIAKNSKSIWHHNPVSGHWWMEQEPLTSFYISGKYSNVLDAYFSIDKCKEHIDFLIKFLVRPHA